MLYKQFSVKFLLIAIIVILLSGISGSGGALLAESKIPAEKSFKAAKDEYSQFMSNSNDWGKRQHWEILIKKFDAVVRDYPRSKRADDSLYLGAGLYSSLYNYSGWSSDLKQSEKRYKLLLQNYHASHLADDALYNLGLIAQKLDDEKGAREYWRKLLKEYPGSDMRKRAQAKLEESSRTKTTAKKSVVRKKARLKKPVQN